MDQPFHSSPPIPSFLDLNEEQPQHDHIFNINTQISLSPPLMINNNNPPQDHDHQEFYYREPQRFQLQAPPEADHKNIFSSGVSYFDDRCEDGDLKLSISWKNNDVQDHTNDHKDQMIMSGSENFNDSVKWTSSKMRIMRKMIITNPDHQTNSSNCQQTPTNFSHSFDHRPMKKRSPTPNFGADQSSSSSSNNNGTIRVCSDCNTTKTPLWRSGPRGPKSLCNACGIRQRKARKALAVAAAAVNGTITAVNTTPMKKITKKHKEKKTKANDNAHCVNSQIKKRGRKKILYFEDLRLSMSKNSSFQRVFPQDEKDAAILLMALSYGLVRG